MRTELEVTLTLAGPIITQSTTQESYGVDAPMARDWNGKYCLPGSLVKGRLRQALEELMDAGLTDGNRVDELLGVKSGTQDTPDEPVDPLRGKLEFGDFVCETAESSEVRYRIQLDPAIGSVKKGAMLVLESPFAPGAEVKFVGRITVLAGDGAEVRTLLGQAFRMVTGFGAERTIGFGRMRGAELKIKAAEGVPNALSIGPGATAMELLPSAPFCVSKPHARDNVLESEAVIPGSVIKGALVSAWLAELGKPGGAEIKEDTDPARPELGRWFGAIRFSHAFPAEKNDNPVRPVVPPLSLIAFGDGDFRDALPFRDGFLLNGNLAPRFRVDWKYKEAESVDTAFGWPDEKRLLRVRTAIDPDSKVAKDEQLFAMETVTPKDITWLFQIDVSKAGADDAPKVATQLNSLIQRGLLGMGKTKVSAALRVSHTAPWRMAAMGERTDVSRDKWTLTLQTPALLGNPTGLKGSGDDVLFKMYAAYWSDVSNSALAMNHFFARQSMVGGYYLHKRFRSGRVYEPWLLTMEGSVFDLEIKDAVKAQVLLEDWLKYGLPLDSWGKAEYGDSWKTCPYVRENGFGEIAINMAAHSAKALQAGEYVDY